MFCSYLLDILTKVHSLVLQLRRLLAVVVVHIVLEVWQERV
jgi:hypothetical protein